MKMSNSTPDDCRGSSRSNSVHPEAAAQPIKPPKPPLFWDSMRFKFLLILGYSATLALAWPREAAVTFLKEPRESKLEWNVPRPDDGFLAKRPDMHSVELFSTHPADISSRSLETTPRAAAGRTLAAAWHLTLRACHGAQRAWTSST